MHVVDHATESSSKSLREFQEGIQQSFEHGAIQSDAYVGVLAGNDHWLLDARDILEASVVPSFVRAGRSPAGVLGIASFRGKILTLVDMQDLLYSQPFRPAEQGWATALNPRYGAAIAMVWPSMAGLLDASRLNLCTFPQGANSYWVKSCWQDESGVIWKQLDIVKWLVAKKWCDSIEEGEGQP